MNELTNDQYDKVKHLLEEPKEPKEPEDFEDMIGKKLFIRTVTYHLVGEVERTFKKGQYVKLKVASWVADSGRFMNAIQEGSLDEVEPVDIVYVNTESITDFFPWPHNLPTEQK